MYKIILLLAIVVLLTGCTEKIDLAQHNIIVENVGLKLDACQYKYEICKAEECPTCPSCPICPAQINYTPNNKSYLSFEQFQDMSVRIKWLKKRLEETNRTEYVRELEDNNSILYRGWTQCNTTLS
ncbi:unnamed protein product, partial [marine sediment metagenome]